MPEPREILPIKMTGHTSGRFFARLTRESPSCLRPAWLLLQINVLETGKLNNEDRKDGEQNARLFVKKKSRWLLSCVERSRPRDHRHPASRTPFSRRNLIPVHRSVTTTLQHQQIIYIHHEDCYCSIRHPFGHCLGFRPYATNCWCVKCSGNDHSDGDRQRLGERRESIRVLCY